jgi:rhamnosyltransferase
MGYGNCILALDTVYNREVLADGGLFFPKDSGALADQMRLIEGDPALVNDLRRKGPERIEKEYTWEKVSDQYDQLFREVASGD